MTGKKLSALKLAVSLLVIAAASYAQSSSILRDTSFTINGTAAKVTMQYPFTKLVDSKIPKTVIKFGNVVYASLGDRKLHLDIFKPKRYAGLLPAVVIIHGGGWRSGDRSMEWPTAIHLAEKGYVAVTVEYRLSPEAKYPASVYDLKSAVRWLRANAGKYKIDADKIAASGCSSGGELAAFIGVTNSNKKFAGGKTNSKYSADVQAVIDIDGILDFTDPNESGKDTILSKPSAGKAWLGYSFKENPEIWREASPINYVDKNCPPICFINSSLPRFHAGRDSVISMLNRLNIYSEVHTIANTPHPFWLFHPWFDETFNYMVKFLDRIFNRK